MHEVPFECSFSGNHVLNVGDVVRWMPFVIGSCLGAATADATVYGGALDSSLSTTIRLPGAVDGTPSAVYALCLAEAGGGGWSTAPQESYV